MQSGGQQRLSSRLKHIRIFGIAFARRCLAAGFLPFLLVTGCSKNPSAPKTQELRLNLSTEPPNLDPRQAFDTTSSAVISLCFDGLMRMGPNNEPVPAIAERYEISADQKTYTFYLRETFWSDGQPVTAHDFETTWKQMLDPGFPCPFSNELYVLKNGKQAKEKLCRLDAVGVKAIDERTLRVDLEHPTPYFLSLVIAFHAVPQHKKPSTSWGSESAGYIGNGPFQLTEWKHHNILVATKNPFYWDQKNVVLEKITLFVIEDPNTELSLFESGGLDFMGNPLSSLPSDALEYLKRKNLFRSQPTTTTYYYGFNTKKFPLNNVNLRRALSLAIPRKEIVENITQCNEIIATGLVPHSLWKENVNYFEEGDYVTAKYYFNLALKEMRITAKEFPSISLSYNTCEGHHKIAQAVQAKWQELFGIQVRLENMEWKVFLDKLASRDFDIARMGWAVSYDDPVAFLNLFKFPYSVGNNVQWVQPQYSALLMAAEKETDQKLRFQLLRNAEHLLIEEMPIAPIYFYSCSFIQHPYVRNIVPSIFNIRWDFTRAYIENDHSPHP